MMHLLRSDCLLDSYWFPDFRFSVFKRTSSIAVHRRSRRPNAQCRRSRYGPSRCWKGILFPTFEVAAVANLKTTFCTALMDTIAEQKRRASYINLDPAAEEFTWEPTIGISVVSPEINGRYKRLGEFGGCHGRT